MFFIRCTKRCGKAARKSMDRHVAAFIPPNWKFCYTLHLVVFGGYFMRTLLLAAALSLAASACTKPYATPEFDAGIPTVGKTRDGLPAVGDKTFTGITQELGTGRELKVFWTHGMCNHDARWALNTYSLFKQALNSSGITTNKAAKSEGLVFRMRPDLELWTYVWSDITRKRKRDLYFDAPSGSYYDDASGLPDRAEPQFPYKRAGANAMLKKTIMNECLADAVIVSGPSRTELYTDAREKVCNYLGGALHADSVTCTVPETREEGTSRIIVAESLGSKIIADAVWALKPGGSDAEKAEFGNRIASIKQIFLLANQIPILDLAGPLVQPGVNEPTPSGAPAKTSLAQLISRISAYRNASVQFTGKPVVVAFSDPNDVLSYRLLNDHISSEARLVNVIVSNDWTFTPPFLDKYALEAPDTAHCDYRGNAAVLSLMVVGNPGKGENTWQAVSDRIESNDKKRCGF